MKPVRICVPLFLAALAAPPTVADGDDGSCLAALEAGPDGRAVSQGLQGVISTNSEQGTRVLFACQADQVSGMTIRLVSGQVADARLILVGAPDYTPLLLSEDGLPPDWYQLGVRRLDLEAVLVTLTVSAPKSAEAGRVFSDRLGLGPAGSNLVVPLKVEIIDEEPLFRDEFDVDPVIGQFSMAHGAHSPSFLSAPESAD